RSTSSDLLPAASCSLLDGGRPAILRCCGEQRGTEWPCGLMSSSAAALALLLLSFTRRVHDQSYSCSFQIQWAMASSSAWLALLVMLLAFPTFQLPLPENGWDCSRRCGR